ncbi:MAG: PSD1 domain-containing protein [Acidobacteria bacterium]|nr:PSD1 domain-containing protein [Acidobacteriota bacterium]
MRRAGLCLLLAAGAAFGQTKIDYAKQVEPLLRARCYPCHGTAQQMNGLRLDDKQAALAGGYSGAVIVPGRSAESKLILRVTGAKGLMIMPPAGKPLAAEEVAALKAWIDQGAAWTDAPAVAAKNPKSSHWAFQPVRQPVTPALAPNPVDAFVLARLKKEGIAPSPEADKSTLLRRIHLDLTGLPPTPQETAEFLAAQRPDAYERVVDRLLASPHFGERWTRPWLDRARYADSDGYEKDWARPYAWRYRHWVIEALNRDLPFDQFTLEQVAGDLLPGGGDQRVATGFHRMTLTNREGGVDNRQFKFENTVDRATTVASTWLGLTMGCAQCHDHKYDPLTQRDFYQLFAFFDHLEEADIDAPLDGELGPWLARKDEYRARRDALGKEYKVAEQQAEWEKDMLRASAHPGERTDWDLAWDCLLKLTEGGDGEKIIGIPPHQRTGREKDILTDHFIRNYHFAVGPKKYEQVKFKELDEKLRKLHDEYPQLSQALAVAEAPGAHPTHLRIKGDYRSPGMEVQPATPAALPPLERRPGAPPTRLDLARWLVSKDNPLTSRVTVNWIWAELFGRGLVKSGEDFGTRGDRPSHPELLDWLAARFMDDGWSMKRLIRLMVISATYRQTSTPGPELRERDPENTLLARQNRVRLPAELIRDSALRAGGLISLEVGGRSIRPHQPEGVMELGYGNRWGNAWPLSPGAERYRRGLYVHFQRSTPYPMLMNFDAPKANVALCRRDRSNSPLQALNLLNDPVFVEAAQALAHQVTAEASDWNARLDQAFLRTLMRRPSAGERERFERFFAKQKDAEPWTAVASVLMNLDEFITRE